MAYRILANYHLTATGHATVINAWVSAFDPDECDGLGSVAFTTDPAAALVFPDSQAALDFYRQVSKTRPIRVDGRANRPLTAYTVTLEPVEGAGA
jgi:hypothetical protein